MCEWCRDNDLLPLTMWAVKSEDEDEIHSAVAVSVDPKTAELVVEVNAGNGEDDSVTRIQIAYCPKCGRPLRGGEK